ncbi:MAG: D-glycero-beta-D-manno-heptose 1-phosphate adenylyltransferase [Bacteroidales bacterium]|nr:D-glycero-beta-D-manno-heptose 1-phosphate adenylyltransferase [Bacteroidales bacterium]
MDFHAKIAQKIVTLPELERRLAALRAAKPATTVVFTNGCFDLVHRGHVDYLSRARNLGDLLVVGLNSDASVHRLKGAARPIAHEDSRAWVLAAFECVDYVVVFEEDTPLHLIERVKPDVLVKGADYSRQTVVGADLVEQNGGRVELIALTPGESTTRLVSRMKQQD